jgi:hypothetical protein
MSEYVTSLQDIVGRVIGDSRTKLAEAAQDTGEKKTPAVPPKASPQAGEAKKDEEKAKEQEKTAALVNSQLQMADALDFIADNIGTLDDDRSDEEKVAEAFAIVEMVEKLAVEGEAIGDAGNAPARVTPPKNPALVAGITPGPTVPNALEHDLKKVPGGTGTQPYKKDGVPTPAPTASEKTPTAPSPTAMETDANAAPGGNSGSVPTKAYPEAGVLKQAGAVPPRFASMHQKLAAAQPTPMLDHIRELRKQASTEPANAYDYIMGKLAAEESGAKISAGTTGTTVDGGDSPGTPAGVGVPAQPKQNEGALRALVTGDLKKVIDMKPRDAAGPPKKRMAELLDAPMQSAAHDSKLNENLGSDVTQAAGTKISSARHVKIAAGRALLRQLAETDEGMEQVKQAAAKLAQDETVQPTGAAAQASDTGEEDGERKKKEEKEKALQTILQRAARAQGEKKEG